MSDKTSIVKTIGRYRAVGELGRGAMGVVYQGFDPVIGRSVALKTLAVEGSDVERRQLRERLYREAAAAGTLTHPNIVTIYDVIEDGDAIAVAMELIEGRDLAALIAEQGRLPLDRALDLFGQVCSALDYAGAKGIVHRDIKPANILLTADNRVKVTDFGIARIAIAGQTQTRTIMGSPSYMSPEQVRGLPLDPRSDLFSAAVMLYEMLTGERPFGGDDIATTMYRIVNEPPRSLEHTSATVGPEISAVLLRALAKNPDDRYPTGLALMAELTRPVTQLCMPVLPPNLSVLPIAPPSRRSPLIYAGAALAVVAVAVVLFGLLGRGRDAPAGQAVAPAIGVPEPGSTSTTSGPGSTVSRSTSGAGQLPASARDSRAIPAPTLPAGVGSALSGGYSTAEVAALVRSLNASLDAPDEKIEDLIRNLKSVSAARWYTRLVAGRPVSAVFIYRSTEAGLIYKRRSGQGTIAFRNTSDRVQLRLSGSSVGASIGGSSEWGIGLVLDLKKNRHFGGTYKGEERGATAADSTMPSAACFSNAAYTDAGKAHDVIFIVAARGLSAGVSQAKLTITPKW